MPWPGCLVSAASLHFQGSGDPGQCLVRQGEGTGTWSVYSCGVIAHGTNTLFAVRRALRANVRHNDTVCLVLTTYLESPYSQENCLISQKAKGNEPPKLGFARGS